MDCQEFQKALSLYLEERWSEIDILGDFQEHIKSCKKCAADFEDATDMHEILVQAKNDADALQGLADFYSQKGDYGKADKLLEKALILKPGDKVIGDLRQSIIEKSVNVYIDGIEQKIEWIKGKVSLFVANACEIIVRLGDKVIFKEKVAAEHLFQGAVSTSFPSGKSDDKPSMSKKEGSITFEVYKGLNKGQLIIKSDKLK